MWWGVEPDVDAMNRLTSVAANVFDTFATSTKEAPPFTSPAFETHSSRYGTQVYSCELLSLLGHYASYCGLRGPHDLAFRALGTYHYESGENNHVVLVSSR